MQFVIIYNIVNYDLLVKNTPNIPKMAFKTFPILYESTFCYYESFLKITPGVKMVCKFLPFSK